MAVVDSLLSLARSQGAQGLVIASGEAPQLVFEDETRSLSMPAIAAETMAVFVAEVTSPEERVELQERGATQSRYEGGSGGAFAVTIEGEAASLRLVFSEAAATPAGETPTAGDASQPPTGGAELPPDEIDAVVRGAVSRSRGAFVEEDKAAIAALKEGIDARLLDLLARMERERASDLILSSGAPPRLRSGGALRALDGPVLDDEGILALLGPALHESARERLAEHGSVDIGLDLPLHSEATRFRVNVFRQARGLAAALRPIRRHPPTLLDLSLPEHLYELAEYPNGLVLVTGPTGSGKSTTLVALVEHLNRSTSRHIVTLEDPIEHVYTPKRSLIHQRELGRHAQSFAEGLRAALREDPDVILVGEMRDRETIAAALTAAETGHLVLSTLHSASPWMSIDRMIDVFPGEQQPQIRAQLSGALRAVLSQHLLLSTSPPRRVPAYEKLVVTPAAANQIRENKIHQLSSTIQTGREDGMVSLEASLAELLRARQIEPRVAAAIARDGQLLGDLARE